MSRVIGALLVASAWGWFKLALLAGAILLWTAVPVWLVLRFARRHDAVFPGLGLLLWLGGWPIAVAVLVRALRRRHAAR